MEEEICLLDSSTASRRQGNCKRSLGRTHCLSSSERMGPKPIPSGDGAADGQTSELAAPFFYHISSDPLPYGWEPSGIYQRADHGILGDQDDTESGTNETLQDSVHCFNCGHPEHKVPDCPFRPDRDLIALSRQYYLFFQGTLGLGKFQRIHAVEASRQERLNWLEEFEPGNIQGGPLKEALESSNEEWLRNISLWGYPPGWISETHPREIIRSRIWEENNGDVADDLEGDSFFEIHGDGHAVETVSFQGAFQAITHSPVNASSTTQDTHSDTSSPCSNPSSHDSESTDCEPPQHFPPLQPIRWANYPPSYFSSHHLIPYVPPLRSTESWSSTLFADTETYLYQFHSRPPPPPEEEPPPLPPPVAPPPLPITSVPPSPPPPPPLQQGIHPHPGFPTQRQSSISECSQIDTSDSDMELSDSE